MAGDWIKVEATTPDKPEVHRMASALGLPPEQVFGCLMRVWIWTDQQSVNGDALSVTEVTLDRIACTPGISGAMRAVGWLSGKDGHLTFPKFERHNGESAKKRALTRDRMQRHRDASSVTTASPEKRREEIEKEKKEVQNQTPRQPALARLSWLPPWIPEDAWKGWLEMRLKKHVPNTDRAMRLAVAKLDVLRTAGEDLAAVVDQSTVSGWTKFYPVSLDRAQKPGAESPNAAVLERFSRRQS